MIAQKKSRGNNLESHFSREALEDVDNKEDDFPENRITDGDLVLSKVLRHRTLEERASEFDGMIGPYDEFPWDRPVGREIW